MFTRQGKVIFYLAILAIFLYHKAIMDDFLKQIITEAGKMAKDFFDSGVNHKAKANLSDLVTDADFAVSHYLVEEIHSKYPDHHIFSEEMEEDINPGAQYEWVIDPIDGTRNFAMGVPMWGIMIAVLKDGELYMSAVSNPVANELFFAEKGKGATMNEKAIYVNDVSSLDHGFSYAVRGVNYKYDKIFQKAVCKLATETDVWMHNLGTMLSVCYVASGGADFYIGNCGMEWDNLAPALIAREAGALVTDSDGNEWKRERGDIIIANPKLHSKVMGLFK